MKLSKEELSLIHLAVYEFNAREIEVLPHRLSNDAFDQLDLLLNKLLIELKK